MLNVKADMSGFNRALEAMKRLLPESREDAIKAALNPGIGELLDRTRKDTNRMVRGFALAANQAGLGPFPVPEVRTAKRLPENRSILARQLRMILWLMGNVRRDGREDSREYRKLVKDSERAKAQLEQLTGTSILIYNKGRGVEFTVRNKIYGGAGNVARSAGSTTVSMKNMEPHAIIMERRNMLVAAILLKTENGAGRVRAKSAMLRTIKRSGVK